MHRHIQIVTFVHPLLMGQHSLECDCLVALLVMLSCMHLLRLAETQLLVKSKFKQPVNMAASCAGLYQSCLHSSMIGALLLRSFTCQGVAGSLDAACRK